MKSKIVTLVLIGLISLVDANTTQIVTDASLRTISLKSSDTLKAPTTPLSIRTLSQKELQEALEKRILVVDTRKKEVVSQGYIPGSLHIENGPKFGSWMKSLVDYHQPLIFVTSDKDKVDLASKIQELKVDQIYGFVTNLESMDLPLDTTSFILSDDLEKKVGTTEVQIVDVRTPSEYNSGHISGAVNIPLNVLVENLEKFNPTKPVIIHCQTGVRAAMAHSILKRNGVKNIIVYSGGIKEWKAQQKELTKPSAVKEE